MTKNKQKLVFADPRQASLFDLLEQERDGRLAASPGRLNIADRQQHAIKQALKRAPKSRDSIADEMTELLGQVVTVSMLNNWASDSHPHEMPGRFYSAFCVATGDMELIRITAEAAGVYTVKGPDALRAEIRREEEEIKVRQQSKRKKEALLSALEGK